MTRDELAKIFDHSILKPNATTTDVIQGCNIARKERMGLVMIQPHFVELTRKQLVNSGILVGTVMSFPHGCDLPTVKAYSAAKLSAAGADEIDMVINIAAVIENNLDLVIGDIAGVVKAAQGKIIKVILETSYLTRNQIAAAAQACVVAGAHFVKTSTGFSDKGATVDDVLLMRQIVGSGIGVKAAGGIRTLDQALAMLKAGANRLGVSASVAILKEWDERIGANGEISI
jgi:deoxyribose-phosphate aldolase